MNKSFVNSLYWHFPLCRTLCNYCDFYKFVPKDLSSSLDQYHSYLKQSWGLHEDLLKTHGVEWGELETLYFGGGTPSFWGEEGVKFVSELFTNNHISTPSKREWTLEVNPGDLNESSLRAWQDLGMNRFSVGAQSLNPKLIPLLGRAHGIKETYETLDLLAQKDLNFSVDLMLGLPESERFQRQVIEELEKVLSYSPSHISVYILTVSDHYIHKDSLPNDEWVREEYLKTSQFLQEQGMHHYEVSNYAYPGFESWHNKRYWKSSPVAAIGPSATGLLFTSKGPLRYKWRGHETSWTEEWPTAEELSLESLYQSLRTSSGLSLKKHFGHGREETFLSLQKKWRERQILLKDQEDHLILNARGRIVLDSLMGEVFSALEGKWS